MEPTNSKVIKFASVHRPDDNRWAIGIYLNGNEAASGFLQWVERGSRPWRVCKSSRADIGKSFYCKAEADEICAELEVMLKAGQIE